MSEHQEIRRRLAVIGKGRKWSANQLKKSGETVRQRENQADAPPWSVIFRTAEEFDRVDRASRELKSESLIEFCRGVLLRRADEILEEKSRGRCPKLAVPAAKVAEKPKKGG